MKRSLLFYKILGNYLFVIALLSILIITTGYKKLKTHYRIILEETLKNTASFTEPVLLEYINNKDFDRCDHYVKEIRNNSDIRITVIAPDGTVIADSEKDPASMENHKNRPEIIQALAQSHSGTSLRQSTTLEKKMLYLAIMLDNGYFVRTSYFSEYYEVILKDIVKDTGLMILIAVFCAVIISIIFTRNITNPVNLICEASQELSQGNFSHRVFLERSDEIKTLAEMYNTMSEKLGSLFTLLKSEKDKTETIINALQEGIAVFSKDGTLILHNLWFKTVYPNAQNGEYYWNIFRSPEILTLIQNSSEKEAMIQEISLSGKNIIVSSYYFDQTAEIIVTFFDISSIKQAEQLKKDIVANVSHELKTPLTSLMGFVETLEDETTQTGKEYLDIIRRNVDRLSNIVKDLSQLSELDSAGIKIEPENFNLAELVSGYLKIFEKRAHDKNILLSSEIPDDFTIYADSFRIGQMCTNLIENAIKYTESGQITVAASLSGHWYIIKFSDTGIGISAEHLPHIFSRFYVANKSRSRKTGGTGLGLSIVKKIAELHGGKIIVTSEVQKGSNFTVYIPTSNS